LKPPEDAAAAASAPPSGLFYLACLLALALPVQMTVTASPFLNAVAMGTRALGPADIGDIRTAEILVNALIAIGLSSRMTKVEPRLLGLCGLMLFVLGNAASMVPGGYGGLFAARVTAGAGAGLMAAAMGALIAQAKAPHRVAALLAIPVTVGSITTAILAGAAAQRMDPVALFGLLACGGTLGLVLFLGAPKGRFQAQYVPAIGSLLGALRRPFVLGSATLFIGSTAVYHFLAGIGASHGVSSNQLGQWAAIIGLICAFVAPVVALVRDRWVRPAYLVALAGFGVGSTLIPLAGSALWFVVGFALQSMAFTAFYLFGAAVMARLDKTGGLQAAAHGWTTLGNAFSPALGGRLIAAGGGAYWPLGVACALASLVTVTLITIGSRGAKFTPAPAPPPPSAGT
jgi:predicted MFS family arabinose efflux permease